MALQTILITYAFISVLCLCIGVAIFDNGQEIVELKALGIKSLQSSIWYAAVFIFLILFLTSVIFSSIGIMLSTRLSTGTTIGMTIAVGVYIPISGLLSTFARKPEVVPVSRTLAALQTLKTTFDHELASNPLLAEVFPDLKNISQQLTVMATDEIYSNAMKTGDTDAFSKIW